MTRPKSMIIGLLTLLTVTAAVQSGSARLQVIHNAADPAAAVVDIYVNDNVYENDSAFREATEFRIVPAGVTLNIQVALGTSSSAAARPSELRLAQSDSMPGRGGISSGTRAVSDRDSYRLHLSS